MTGREKWDERILPIDDEEDEAYDEDELEETTLDDLEEEHIIRRGPGGFTLDFKKMELR